MGEPKEKSERFRGVSQVQSAYYESHKLLYRDRLPIYMIQNDYP